MPTGPCPDVCVELWQNDRSLGTVKPLITEDDIEDLYGYFEDGANVSFNGRRIVPLVPEHSLIFIHQDTEKCDVSFAIVHDSRDECSGGTVEMYITGDLENAVVQDGKDSPSDHYIYHKEYDETECFWEWSWDGKCRKRTDGLAHYWDANEYECINITPDFRRGIDVWEFVSGEGLGVEERANPDDYIKLDREEMLTFCYVQC